MELVFIFCANFAEYHPENIYIYIKFAKQYLINKQIIGMGCKFFFL